MIEIEVAAWSAPPIETAPVSAVIDTRPVVDLSDAVVETESPIRVTLPGALVVSPIVTEPAVELSFR